MTGTGLAPFHPPGTPGYAQAGASFQLAAPVDPAGVSYGFRQAGWSAPNSAFRRTR